MPLFALLNRTCTIVHSSTSDDTDAYGNPVPGETVTDVACELQQVQRTEPAGHGELSRTDWLLILPASTLLATGDQVLVDGEAYEVTGDPWRARNPRTGLEHHVEATLRRTAGADDEATGS